MKQVTAILLVITFAANTPVGGQSNLSHPVVVLPKADASGTGELRFRELNAAGANYVGFKAASPLSADTIWTLPSIDGAAGQCLVTSGAKVLSWAACGGGGALPVVDTTNIAYGSVDPTKLVRFEVDGITTGTTRVLTVPDADITLVGAENTQTISGNKTLSYGSTTLRDGISSQDWRMDWVYASGSGVGDHGYVRFWDVVLGEYRLTLFSKYAGVTPYRVATLNGTFLPLLDATYDLGTITGSNRRWKDGWFSGNVTAVAFLGNATTATALASDPADCAPGEYARSIDVYGNLTCATAGIGTVTSVTRTLPIVVSPTTGDVVVSCPTCATTDTTQTISGTKTFSVDQIFSNDIKVNWKDALGTDRPALWMDGGNNFHVGVQTAPLSGGDISLYVGGNSVLRLFSAGGSVYHEPQTDRNAVLGTVTKRFNVLNSMFLHLFSSKAAASHARIDLQTADEVNTTSLLAAQVGGGSYNIYLPSAPPPGASYCPRTIAAAPNYSLEWYDCSSSGGLTGSGTTGYLAQWTGATALGNSALSDSGTAITFNVRNLNLQASQGINWSTGSFILPDADGSGNIGTLANRIGYLYTWFMDARLGMYLNGTQVMDSSRNLTNINSLGMAGPITGATSIAMSGALTGATNVLTGSGLNTYLPKFTGTLTLANSNLLDGGSYMQVLANDFWVNNLSSNSHNVYDIGDPTFAFRSLYLGGSLYMGGIQIVNSARELVNIGNVRPAAAASYELGSSVYTWANLHLATGLYMGGYQVMNSSRNLTNIGAVYAVGQIWSSGGLPIRSDAGYSVGGSTGISLSCPPGTYLYQPQFVGGILVSGSCSP